jgi:hypothetical protein
LDSDQALFADHELHRPPEFTAPFMILHAPHELVPGVKKAQTPHVFAWSGEVST